MIKKIAAATAVATVALMGTAGSAQASVHATPARTSAVTVLSNRADSGGNGNWATDGPVFRTLTVTDHGRDAVPAKGDDFTATVSDRGLFITIPNAFTPNQGGANAGHRITGQVIGTFTGGATYTFTATKAPNGALVPFTESGTPVSGPRTTGLWFEQAFPAGTVFTGGIDNTWSWTYTGNVRCFLRQVTQRWTDAAANSGGQSASAGNITGRCS